MKTIRENFFKQIPGFDWYDVDGKPYGLLSVYSMTEKEVNEIRKATEAIAGIYDKTAPLLRTLPDKTLVDLGLPANVLPFIREKKLPYEAIIRRIDMVRTSNGWKHFEINADTPTVILECFRVNGYVTKHFGLKNANEGCEEQLQRAIQNAVFHSYQGTGFPKLVFTASRLSAEDIGTSKYLAETSGLPCEFYCLEDLRIIPGVGLFTPNGEPIDILYRQTHPVEFLAEEENADGLKIGIELLKLVKDEKLSVINPLSAFLLQSKAIQAVIWSLHEENSPFFTKEEHETIEKHFIPTYLDKESFLERGKKFVAKPVFGREGDTVEIFNEKGEPLNNNPLKNYEHFLKIYQEYVELPTEKITTPDGEISLHLLLGSFIINDKASAFGIRAGGIITGNNSCFLSIGVS